LQLVVALKLELSVGHGNEAMSFPQVPFGKEHTNPAEVPVMGLN
jgi:hypothetical protein